LSDFGSEHHPFHKSDSKYYQQRSCCPHALKQSHCLSIIWQAG